jgi:hypothetical protein
MRRAPGFTIAKKSLSELRLALLHVASQTTKAFSHCYTSLESLLKAKWQRIRPPARPTISTHVYEIRPRADKCGIDLISDVLPFGRLWYAEPKCHASALGPCAAKSPIAYHGLCGEPIAVPNNSRLIKFGILRPIQILYAKPLKSNTN